MEEVVLSSTVDLTNGGCNACGTVKSTSYQLEIGESTMTLDGLTVSSVVMSLALYSGFKQEFKVNMMDEFTEFRKKEKLIVLTEEYDKLIYKSQDLTIQTPDHIQDYKLLFETANKILIELFQIEKLKFIY
ncbi:DUF4809 family protein [Vagococcus intermedius]|uniref:DUF4809 family protein n=1 Tax=Vagococcus intermedius TaxID=2991418 RepID=A0AAF0CWM5_9ENTE|nr:DUF4809 family protein [Vagococcus intermedius]WEG74239.1 DUF4809 family protein [Vagococcus intermedius]WEG76321.1 DUF4809 family protein [Vagococcus intermedius]